MSTNTIARHTARITTLWPTDPLRPALRMQSALSRISPSSTSTSTSTTPTITAPDLNALYSLLDNRYSRAYPLSPRYLRPRSKESYYDDLMSELEQSTRRTWWQGVVTRVRARLRLE